MVVERRGRAIDDESGQLATGGARSSNGRRQPSIDGTSRMMREYQVRICERLGVKFPGPTRQSRHFGRVPVTSGLPLRADSNRTSLEVRFVPITEVACITRSPRQGGERTGGHGEAKRFGGPKVDDKIEFSGLQDWV